MHPQSSIAIDMKMDPSKASQRLQVHRRRRGEMRFQRDMITHRAVAVKAKSGRA